MVLNKVEICGVNTAKLPLLSDGEKEVLFEKIKAGTMAKGDVLGVARIAGIMGAKRTSELIPLCHILNLTKLNVDFVMYRNAARLRQSVPPRPPEKPVWRWRRSPVYL